MPSWQVNVLMNEIFAALALALALALLHSIRKYENIHRVIYIPTRRRTYMRCMCVYNLQSLIHLRCELLTKECKGGNDKKVMVVVWLYVVLYTIHSFDHSVPVPLPFESFEIKFGCHHYTTPNTHINTQREHKLKPNTHTHKHYCVYAHTNRKSNREKVKVKRINSENGRRSCCALRLLLFSSILLSHHVRSESMCSFSVRCACVLYTLVRILFNVQSYTFDSIQFISFRLRVIRFLYV